MHHCQRLMFVGVVLHQRVCGSCRQVDAILSKEALSIGVAKHCRSTQVNPISGLKAYFFLCNASNLGVHVNGVIRHVHQCWQIAGLKFLKFVAHYCENLHGVGR
eukprot:c10331_g1_i1 orf=240-551(+)